MQALLRASLGLNTAGRKGNLERRQGEWEAISARTPSGALKVVKRQDICTLLDVIVHEGRCDLDGGGGGSLFTRSPSWRGLSASMFLASVGNKPNTSQEAWGGAV